MNPGRRRSAGVLVGLALAASALLGGAASAAVRHASPGGDGPAASCPAADPCSLEDAVEDPSVADGDEVVLADGDYVETDTLTVTGEVTVRGRARGFAGARIISPADPAIFMITPAATVRDLTLIKQDDKGQGFLIANGTLDRAQVIAPDSVACELGSVDPGNAVIRNTACSSGGDAAVLIEHDGAGLEFAVLDNVTAYSSSNQIAIHARGINNGQVQLAGRNVIALGGSAKDIVASDNGGGSLAAVTMAGSAYDEVAAGGNSAVTAVGSGTNTAGPVRLADPAGRDFRQTPHSATIDAGAIPPAIGPFDYSGERRVQGGAIDIGADESVDRERILKLLGKRIKARRKLRLKARCVDVPCKITGKALVKPKRGKRKARKLPKTVAGAGGKAAIGVRLPRRLAKRLARRGGKVKVRAVGADPVGFRDREVRTYEVKRRRR